MITFFLTCFVIGGVVLLLQLLFGILGADHDAGGHDFGSGHDLHAHDGLDLLSVRALSAALTFFGGTGYMLLRGGWPALLAVAAALAVGFGSAVGVGMLMRSLRRLEMDKSFDISRAVGLQGQVYLSIPGSRSGAGKVHLNMHDRLMELDAVTGDSDIPTGTSVLVVDVVSSDTLLVTRAQPLLSELNDA